MLEETSISWKTTHENIVSVDQNGKITALATGQTSVFACAGAVQSKQININVVADEEDVAQVEVSSPLDIIYIDESFQLSVFVKNVVGYELTGYAIKWFSEPSDVVEIDNNGMVTGIAAGE